MIAWSNRRTALRLGLELEIAESVEARSPPGAVQILRRVGDETRPFMRAGGLELSVGVAAELRFGTAPRPRPQAQPAI